jgi:hypothetical protein
LEWITCHILALDAIEVEVTSVLNAKIVALVFLKLAWDKQFL